MKFNHPELNKILPEGTDVYYQSNIFELQVYLPNPESKEYINRLHYLIADALPELYGGDAAIQKTVIHY